MSVAPALCERVPLVPVTVIVKVPRGVLLLVLIVRVEVPGAVTGFLENVGFAPAGRPDVESDTLPANPFCGVTVTE